MKATISPPPLTFAETLTELEKIVGRLESGELPLEQSLSEFERGIRLAKEGQQRLQQAEQRIEILLSEDSQAPLTPFNPDVNS